MRKKREIVELEALAKSKAIVFPLDNSPFSQYKSNLREIIEDNCGHAVSKTLSYCNYDQVFYVTIEASGQLLIRSERDDSNEADNANVTFTRGVTIDPQKPLLPQIERINEVKEAVWKRHNLLSTLLSFHNDGYTMVHTGKSTGL